jgi:hypothetical protein
MAFQAMNTHVNHRRWCVVPNPSPQNSIDVQEIIARNNTARQIINGFAADMPTLSEVWHGLQAALQDTSLLIACVVRLSAELNDTRLDRANLLAAARATITAHADGEPDPLYYLRDELDARHPASSRSRRRS